MSPAPPRTSNRRAARREEIRRRLLAVIEPALESGETYNDLSIGRLVDNAGISRSTFYTYFEDKGDLLTALTEHVITDMIEAGRQWWALPPDAGKAQLHEALRGVATSYRRHGPLWSAIVQTAAYDPAVRAQYESTIQLAINEIAAHIRTGQANGSVDPDLDPDSTAIWITWMGERGLHQAVRIADPDATEELTAALTQVVWKILYQNTRRPNHTL
jgi:AcrR family transcriptional regulator